jgi:hypothetical protein
MLKLKENQTKPVIYQGLEVNVPADTNFMWLQHTGNKLLLMASTNKPVWSVERHFYLIPRGTTKVAELENTDLTVEQVKNSLETDESLPRAQVLEQLAVVNNLIKNLRSFANSLERNVAKASHNPSHEGIQALLQHVYADEGELDTFYDHAIEEATEYGIVAEQDEDSDEDHEACLNSLMSSLNNLYRGTA